MIFNKPVKLFSPKCQKLKVPRPISSLIKYRFNKLWFNVKFPNQFFKREEKSNSFLKIFRRKNAIRAPGCRATPSYSELEIEDTGRQQRKRCLYLNRKKQIQLDYINLQTEMQRRKARPNRLFILLAHYSIPLLLKFYVMWVLNIMNARLLMLVVELKGCHPRSF